ncbi:MAG TPA: hypothetical protein VFV99_27125 [Kofleriaceae bacterium]|nr:hypothetical protein [Kofleriaceae bacterium]
MRLLLRVVMPACLLVAGCKDKQQTPAPATAPKPAPTQPAQKPSLPTTETPATSAAPTAPAEQPAPPGKPITVAEATAALPTITSPQLIALKQTSNQEQVHGTWCIDGTSADDVAKQVGHLLAQAKYTGISIRGDAKKAGVSGDREGVRFSMVVSASSAAVCAAPAHYFASATIFKI